MITAAITHFTMDLVDIPRLFLRTLMRRR